MRGDLLCEINRSIFRFKPVRPSIPSIVAAIIAVFGALGTSLKEFDPVVGRLLSAVLRSPPLPTTISTSVWAKVGTAIFLFLALYTILFGYHAFDLAYKKSKTFQQLEQEKQSLLASNYQTQLAEAVGLVFHHIWHSHKITNFDGNAEIMREEKFSVTGLKLAHLVRKYRSSSATCRSQPSAVAEKLPQGTRLDKKYE